MQNGRVIGTYWLLGRRVSECRMNKEADMRTRRQLAVPINLEQKPLYRLDNFTNQPWLSPLPSPGTYSEDEDDMDMFFACNNTDSGLLDMEYLDDE